MTIRPFAVVLALAALGCGKKPPAVEAPQPPAPQCLPAFEIGVPQLDASGCPPAPATPDVLDEALAKLGLTRCTFTYPDSWRKAFSFVEDGYRLPYTDVIHDHPLLLPPFARKLGADLDAAASSSRPVAQAIAVASSRLGYPLTQCDPGPDLQAASDDAAPFAHAVADLIRRTGGTADDAALAAQAQAMPVEFQRALVPVVRILSEAAAQRAGYLRQAPGLASELAKVPSMVLAMKGTGINLSDDKVRKALAELNTGIFADYAARLALAVESADLGRFRDTTGFSFTAITPLGAIVIRDGAANTYSPDEAGLGSNILLLVDTGGDDVYRVPVGATVDNQPAALAIDLGGNDQYGYVEVPNQLDGARLPSDAAGRYTPRDTPAKDNGPISLSSVPRQGAAILGVGMLFDLGGGKDHYRSLRMSQGFGALGVGVLYDDGGDDLYDLEAMGQGAAMFGIGLALDGSGADVRKTYYSSQGFGFVRAFGALIDSSGDDQYLADVGDPAQGGDPLYWSIQLPGKANQSCNQGCGFGRRDDTNRWYMSGGIGILRDRAGNDRYRSSVFTQASGYWFGTGILLDGGGDDSYDSLWYSQASTAHFALAAFIDEGGNDKYNQELQPVATGPGVGHDFGVSFLIDLGGDDQMRGSVLALGSGNENGTGVLINLGGNDSYTCASDGYKDRCYGAAIGSDPSMNRTPWPTYGIFLDVGGTDTYVVQGSPLNRDGTSWDGTKGNADAKLELGVGIDRNEGTVQLP